MRSARFDDVRKLRGARDSRNLSHAGGRRSVSSKEEFNGEIASMERTKWKKYRSQRRRWSRGGRNKRGGCGTKLGEVAGKFDGTNDARREPDPSALNEAVTRAISNSKRGPLAPRRRTPTSSGLGYPGAMQEARLKLECVRGSASAGCREAVNPLLGPQRPHGPACDAVSRRPRRRAVSALSALRRASAPPVDAGRQALEKKLPFRTAFHGASANE